MTYFGIDVHQRQSETCGISDEGEVVVRQRVMTTLSGLRQALGAVERSSVVLECGPSGLSPISPDGCGRVARREESTVAGIPETLVGRATPCAQWAL